MRLELLAKKSAENVKSALEPGQCYSSTYSPGAVPNMRDSLLPFSLPSISDEEISEVTAALRSGWITSGPRCRQFEEEFARFTEAPAALALNSGTAALHLALASIGAGPGDAVITSTMTFCACAHVIEQVGARPVLVDVEADTLNIDPILVEKAAKGLRSGERLTAIMPVHLYGHPYERGALFEIARRYRCAVIEDAAHAFPLRYECSAGVPVLTAFSFYATKNLTTGEGGMLAGPKELISRARLLSLHGITRDVWNREQENGDPWAYDVTAAGFKYNMSDIQAALGIVQLAKTEALAARRRWIAARYDEAFADLDEVEIPARRPGVEHAWHIYALRLNGRNRREFIAELRRRNIAASVHFLPVHMLRYYADKYGYQPGDFPVAFKAWTQLVSLPIYPEMSDGDVEDVIAAVKAGVGCWVGA